MQWVFYHLNWSCNNCLGITHWLVFPRFWAFSCLDDHCRTEEILLKFIVDALVTQIHSWGFWVVSADMCYAWHLCSSPASICRCENRCCMQIWWEPTTQHCKWKTYICITKKVMSIKTINVNFLNLPSNILESWFHYSFLAWKSQQFLSPVIFLQIQI